MPNQLLQNGHGFAALRSSQSVKLTESNAHIITPIRSFVDC